MHFSAACPKIKAETKRTERAKTRVKKLKKNELLDIDVMKIETPNVRPRKSFDMYELTLLAESLRLNGMIQPIVVKKSRQGFILVSGERRLRAATMAGFITVPCVVLGEANETISFFPIVENTERKRLSMFEEAEAIAELMDIQGVSQSDAAEHLGLSQPALSNKLRLLRLSEPERRKIELEGFSERQARALVKIDDAKERLKIIDKIADEKLNTRQTEELIDDFLAGKVLERSPEPNPSRAMLDERILKNTLSKMTETLKRSGIPAETQYLKTDEGIEFSLRVSTMAIK